MRKSVCAMAATICAAAMPVSAGELERLDAAITGGEPIVDMRYRFESADDQVNDPAQASTLRTRLGYETGDYHGFSVLGEMEDLSTIGNNRFAPVDPGYAVIADPPATVLNRAQIDYQGITGLHATLGRQRIVIDNARHVGDVAWRQNNQTYDAARLRYGMFGFNLDYSHIRKVNAVNPAQDDRVDHHLFRASFHPVDALKVGYYGFFLDNEDGWESDTHGIDVRGEPRFLDRAWHYRLEFARQRQDFNGDEFDPTYLLVQGGTDVGPLGVTLAHEMLASDGGDAAFQTDLATKHGFNGWADVFLTTPAEGLVDTHLMLDTQLDGEVNLALRYHRFRSDSGSLDYGNELNLQLTRSWGAYTLGAKMARFHADEIDQVDNTPDDDVDRYWLWAEMKF